MQVLATAAYRDTDAQDRATSVPPSERSSPAGTRVPLGTRSLSESVCRSPASLLPHRQTESGPDGFDGGPVRPAALSSLRQHHNKRPAVLHVPSPRSREAHASVCQRVLEGAGVPVVAGSAYVRQRQTHWPPSGDGRILYTNQNSMCFRKALAACLVCPKTSGKEVLVAVAFESPHEVPKQNDDCRHGATAS